MHDPPVSRVRCLSSVQFVRTSQSRGAPHGASVPASTSASRRIPLAVRSSTVVWELGQSRQLLLRAHRQCPRLRFGPLESASGSGGRVVAKHRLRLMSPSVSLVGAPVLQGCVNMVTAERQAKNPRGVEQNIRNLTNLALVKFRGFSARPQIQGSKLNRCRAFMLSPAKPWEIGAQERSCREEIARAGRSLGAQHGREGHDPRGSRRAPRHPARRRPLVGWSRRPPRTSFRQRSLSCGALKRNRQCHRRSGELRAQSCECSEKQTTFHFTSLPCHHFIMSPHAPNRSNF